jgi:SAM-dependent methyltransferase
VLLAQRGYDMIGVDNSEDMLSLARMKPQGEDVLWLCQEGGELDLYGDIDCAVCTLDSVNHILDFDELVRVFKRVSLFMNRGGRFVFDVNTVYKHREILGDNCFVWEDDGVFCAWQNEYDEGTNTVNMQLDFFIEHPDGYDRETQYVTERAYTRGQILEALRVSGFELVAEYDDMTFNAPDEESERVFYVAKNVKE